jgi:L-threonylcarbamoyladenylate synthase
LAADALQPQAVKKVFTIKQRPPDMPLLVLISEHHEAHRLAHSVSPMAKNLMTRFWPGNLTLILPARPHLPRALTAESGNIGIRQTKHPVAAALVRACGTPITGTSANLSGQPGCRRVEDLDPSVARGVDLVLECGPLAGGKGSTIVDTTQVPAVILREGSIPGAELAPFLLP